MELTNFILKIINNWMRFYVNLLLSALSGKSMHQLLLLSSVYCHAFFKGLDLKVIEYLGCC